VQYSTGTGAGTSTGSTSTSTTCTSTSTVLASGWRRGHPTFLDIPTSLSVQLLLRPQRVAGTTD
jgi:hypothetical protein